MVFINTFNPQPIFKSIDINVDVSNLSEQGKLFNNLQKLRTEKNKSTVKSKKDIYILDIKLNKVLSLITASVIIYGLIKIKN